MGTGPFEEVIICLACETNEKKKWLKQKKISEWKLSKLVQVVMLLIDLGGEGLQPWLVQ
jgi:hypothetical protein